MVGVLSGYYLFAYFSNEPKSGHWFDAYYVVGGLSLFAFLVLLSAKLDESPIKRKGQQLAGRSCLDAQSHCYATCRLFFVICAFSTRADRIKDTMNWLPTFTQKLSCRIQEQLAIILASILSCAIASWPLSLQGLILRRLSWFAVLMGLSSWGQQSFCLSLFISLIIPDINQPIDSFFSDSNSGIYISYHWDFLAPIYPALNSVVLSSLPKGPACWNERIDCNLFRQSEVRWVLLSRVIYLMRSVESKHFIFSFIPILILARIHLLTFKRSRYKNK